MVGIPIPESLVACALVMPRDDFLGIISSGLTCLVVGSASLSSEGVEPANDAPPGHGIQVDDSLNHMVVLESELVAGFFTGT